MSLGKYKKVCVTDADPGDKDATTSSGEPRCSKLHRGEQERAEFLFRRFKDFEPLAIDSGHSVGSRRPRGAAASRSKNGICKTGARM